MTTQNRNRFETLAHGLAAGTTVEQAMLAAGYAPETARQGRVQHNGRLVSPNNHPDVAARLAELRTEASGRTVVTIYAIVAKLDRAYDLAEEERNPSAMVQAAMGMAKALGLIVDRKHHVMKPIDRWTEAECLAALGEDDAAAHLTVT